MLAPPGTLEVVTIGDELLRGDVVDGNAAWLGRVLGAAGIRVMRRATVGDDDEAIRAAVRDALGRTGVVLCTGGLGPTSDDRTKPAIAALYDRPLRTDPVILAGLERYFARRGRPMPDINRTQAEVPEGATVFANPAGTAPGIGLERSGLGLVLLLPGVPLEVRALMHEGGVLAFLEAYWGGALARISGAILRTTGIPESALFERVRDLVDGVRPVAVSFLPGTSGVDMRFTDMAVGGAGRVEDAVTRFRERIAEFIYCEDERDLEEVVGALVEARGWMIAVAESCTGGLLAKRLTDVPGCSAYVDGGVVSYANQAKQRWLGVQTATLDQHGAVSEAIALEMVNGICAATGAACGVSITGVAGPGGGSAEKPVGTVWIGVRAGGPARARRYRFGGSRAEIRERAAQAALRELQLALERRGAAP